MLKAFHLNTQTHLNAVQFAYLCPALIYQLDSEVCRKRNNQHDHDKEAVEIATFDLSKIPGKGLLLACWPQLITSFDLFTQLLVIYPLLE